MRIAIESCPMIFSYADRIFHTHAKDLEIRRDLVVSIEHEDRSFEGDEELVKRGFLLARNTLRPLIV